MGNKRRILRNPKFRHLKKIRFSSLAEEPQPSNSEEQEMLEEQLPVVETPILDAAQEVQEEVQEEVELAAAVEEEAKPKITIKKSSPKKKTTTKKPRARKTTTKRKSTKTKV